jgi:hypothetical protein
MNHIKIKSVYGNDILISKTEDTDEGFYQVVFNSDGYILDRDNIEKLKDFFTN